MPNNQTDSAIPSMEYSLNMILEDICAYLHNYFVKWELHDTFIIHENQLLLYNADGTIDMNPIEFPDVRFIRIVGGGFVDSVWAVIGTQLKSIGGSESFGQLPDGVFKGAVWAMDVPMDLYAIAKQVMEWRNKYEAADSPLNTPFTSESFGGYSYSKNTPSNGSKGCSWQDVFASRLKKYRKI